MALAEYATDLPCAVPGSVDCTSVEFTSVVILKYDSRLKTFSLSQEPIPTSGARAVRFFSTTMSGKTEHFLAVAEHRDNNLDNVQSSIWKWNGEMFSLYQRIDTLYAEDVEVFEENGQVFLVIANRGCPSADDASCDGVSISARTTIWTHDTFNDKFVRVAESDAVAPIHPYLPTQVQDDGTVVTPTALPSGITVFRLPAFNFGEFGDLRTFLAIASAGVTEADRSDNCGDSLLRPCHPANIFEIKVETVQGIRTIASSSQNNIADQERRFADIESKLFGGDNIFFAIRK